MIRRKFINLLSALFIFLTISVSGQVAGDNLKPRQVVLTWQSDPSTSMTITWRTDERGENHSLRYAELQDGPNRQWKALEAETFTFEETSAWLHTAELNDLKPGRKYSVIIDHPTHPDLFNFQTMPDNENRRELVFLAGGDSRSRRDVRQEMNELAILENPDFIIFDGDFINNALSEEQWDDWFDDWHDQMITADGLRIPVVPSIGNHEVEGSYLQPRENAPFYMNRFVVPEPRTYYVLQMSPDLVLVTLDTDHIVEVTDQTEWLDKTLEANKDVRWKLVQWHVAAWPSVRDFDGGLPRKIREHWIPVIEKHNVDLVIEAHDHAYKKTLPIRNNSQDDENGIVYIGDGGWGAPIRDTKDPSEYWWLEEAVKIDHFWKLTLSEDGSDLQVEPVFRPAGKTFTLQK
ncbi:MAG: fibronectin type III domain-containing protein [Bacteroidales bacterium]